MIFFKKNLSIHLRDPHGVERLHVPVRVEPLLLHPAGVDDEDAVVDGDGRLRQVGRDHDLALARLLEHGGLEFKDGKKNIDDFEDLIKKRQLCRGKTIEPIIGFFSKKKKSELRSPKNELAGEKTKVHTIDFLQNGRCSGSHLLLAGETGVQRHQLEPPSLGAQNRVVHNLKKL